MRGAPISILTGQVGVKNNMVNEILGGLPNFVGELVVGRPESEHCYERSMAFINDEYAIELFVFWAYDLQTNYPYPLKDRLGILEAFVQSCGPNIQYVDHELIESTAALLEYKTKILERNFPGVILREPYGTFGTEDEEITPETAIS